MTGSRRAPSPVILRVCFENREAALQPQRGSDADDVASLCHDLGVAL